MSNLSHSSSYVLCLTFTMSLLTLDCSSFYFCPLFYFLSLSHFSSPIYLPNTLPFFLIPSQSLLIILQSRLCTKLLPNNSWISYPVIWQFLMTPLSQPLPEVFTAVFQFQLPTFDDLPLLSSTSLQPESSYTLPLILSGHTLSCHYLAFSRLFQTPSST